MIVVRIKAVKKYRNVKTSPSGKEKKIKDT